MRTLDRRLSLLEAGTNGDEQMRSKLDMLSDADLERLEQIVMDRDAGLWTDISALSENDQRILVAVS